VCHTPLRLCRRRHETWTFFPSYVVFFRGILVLSRSAAAQDLIRPRAAYDVQLQRSQRGPRIWLRTPDLPSTTQRLILWFT